MQLDIDRIIAARECPAEAAGIEAELAAKRPGLDLGTIAWSYQWAVQLPQHAIVGLAIAGRDQRREARRLIQARPASLQQHLSDLEKPQAPLGPNDTAIALINQNGAVQTYRLLGGYVRTAGGKEKYRRLVLQDPQSTYVGLYTVKSRHEVLYAGGFQPAARERFFAAQEGDPFTWKSIRMTRMRMADAIASIDIQNPVRCTDIDRN